MGHTALLAGRSSPPSTFYDFFLLNYIHIIFFIKKKIDVPAKEQAAVEPPQLHSRWTWRNPTQTTIAKTCKRKLLLAIPSERE